MNNFLAPLEPILENNPEIRCAFTHRFLVSFSQIDLRVAKNRFGQNQGQNFKNFDSNFWPPSNRFWKLPANARSKLGQTLAWKYFIFSSSIRGWSKFKFFWNFTAHKFQQFVWVLLCSASTAVGLKPLEPFWVEPQNELKAIGLQFLTKMDQNDPFLVQVLYLRDNVAKWPFLGILVILAGYWAGSFLVILTQKGTVRPVSDRKFGKMVIFGT